MLSGNPAFKEIPGAALAQVGAVGGAILAIPYLVASFCAIGLYSTLKENQRSGAAFLVSITLLPSLPYGFAALRGLVGWAILKRTIDSELQVGNVVAMAVLGSVCARLLLWFIGFWLGCVWRMLC